MAIAVGCSVGGAALIAGSYLAYRHYTKGRSSASTVYVDAPGKGGGGGGQGVAGDRGVDTEAALAEHGDANVKKV